MVIFLSFMISAAKYTVPSELPKNSGVLQYGKVKFTSFSTKGDLQSLSPTKEGV